MRAKIQNPKSVIQNPNLPPLGRGRRGGSRYTLSRGFTLVEILTVITIIAILMTLTVSVVGAFIGQARETATTTTLTKIQALMNSRRQAFNRLLLRKGFLTNSFEYQYAKSMSQSPSLNMPSSAIKPVATKLLQMKYFPQSANDLNFLMFTVYQSSPPAQLQLANMYPKLFQSFSNNSSFVAPLPLPNLTNPEILYNVLTENVIGDSPLGTDYFSAQEVVTEPVPQVSTAGLPYLIDAWKGPIRFYRWPTRLFLSQGLPDNRTQQQINTDLLNAKFVFSALPVFTGNLKQDLQRDPDDPLQTCLTISNFETLFHTPATFHMPLIVSAGPDGQFGLASPDQNQNSATPGYGYLAIVDPSVSNAQDQLADNLVSASIKAGGK
jgi:prepilin-type N-terminal cleavage/methylation domain-containing protein